VIISSQVCTNKNETWNSDCEVYRQRCLCDNKDEEGCKDSELKHIHIDYYGECKEMPVSTNDQTIFTFTLTHNLCYRVTN
jgi:hypothetical protein